MSPPSLSDPRGSTKGGGRWACRRPLLVWVMLLGAFVAPAGAGQADREEGVPLGYKDLVLGMSQQEAESKLSGRDPRDVAEARAALEREEAQARIGAERTCRDQIDTNPQQLPREWTHDDVGRPVPPDTLYQRCVRNRFDLWRESIRGRQRRIEGFILQKYRRIADVPVGPPKLAFHEGKLVQVSVVARGEENYKRLRDAVHAKFGKPTMVRVRAYTNAQGAKRNGLTEQWVGGGGVVALSVVSSVGAAGDVIAIYAIADEGFLKMLDRRRRERAGMRAGEL